MNETTRTNELLELERADPFAPHDLGCRCYPHVSQRAAVEAATQAAVAEYRIEAADREELRQKVEALPHFPGHVMRPPNAERWVDRAAVLALLDTGRGT